MSFFRNNIAILLFFFFELAIAEEEWPAYFILNDSDNNKGEYKAFYRAADGKVYDGAKLIVDNVVTVKRGECAVAMVVDPIVGMAFGFPVRTRYELDDKGVYKNYHRYMRENGINFGEMRNSKLDFL